jgi:predicted RNA-binding Zn-ribbon protein involved in translation (DUF1610 family)
METSKVIDVLNILRRIEELKCKLFYDIKIGRRIVTLKNEFVADEIRKLREVLDEKLKELTFEEWQKLLPHLSDVDKFRLSKRWIILKGTCPKCGSEIKYHTYEWGSFDHYDVEVVYRCPKCGIIDTQDWQEPR